MRRAILLSLVVAVGILVTEGLAWLTFAVVEPGGYQRAQIRAGRDRLLARADEPDAAAATSQPGTGQVLHPFLGYVVDPTVDTRQPVSVHGFPIPPGGVAFGERSPNEVVVAILGGSVAKHFAVFAGDVLAQRLQDAGGEGGPRVVIENLAVPSYKEPQQLMSLAWRLALASPPDLVIDLDGFNDVVLGWAHNVPAGVYAFYPQDWRSRVAGAADLGELRLLGRLEVLKEERRALARRHTHAPLSWSVTADLVWARLDHTLVRRIGDVETELLAERPPEGAREFRLYGPDLPLGDPGQFLDAAVALWGRSSILMDGMCRRVGARYYHFLQPNQYVDHSKRISDRERAQAWDPAFVYAVQVRRAYPRLQQAGQELARSGVRFHDLTGIFAGHDETLYVDPCCHLNLDGNRLLADAIADAILSDVVEPGR